MLYLLLLLISPTWSSILGEWDDPLRDSVQPNFGHECESQENESSIEPTMKWYMDGFREKVYPFLYLGCNGDDNRYDTMLTAKATLPKDTSQCIGFNMTGWPNYEEADLDLRCPNGTTYLPYGEFAAICCNNATRIRYKAEVASLCPNGEQPLQHTIVYMDEYGEMERDEQITLTGRNCSHRFCPETEEYHCVQGEFEARCCPGPLISTAAPTDIIFETASPSETQHQQQSEGSFLDGNRRIFVILGICVVILCVLSLFCTYLVCKSRRNRRLLAYAHEKETSALNP